MENKDKRAAAIAALIVRDVAEIPDRCSPDDQPEMMLVTSDELTDIVMRRLAAQNARAGLLGRAVEAISECLPDEDLNDLSPFFQMECKRHHFERLKDVRDEMDLAIRAAKENQC